MKNFCHNLKITFLDDRGREGLLISLQILSCKPELGAALQTVACKMLFTILLTIVQNEC